VARTRTRWLLGVALLAAALGVLLDRTGALERPELDTVDARFSVRGETAPPAEVAVVAIDSATFSSLGERWPFPRSLHARAVDALRRDGARVIAYDVQFTERTTAREDDALLRSVQRAGNVVLATTETFPDGTSPVFGGEDTLRAVRATSGHTLMPNDPGGVIRRLPYRVGGLRGFAVVAAERATGRRVDPGALGASTAPVDFHGGPGTFAATSFADLVEGRFPRGRFRDRIVLVGPSAPSLQDLHATATTGRDLMAGVEVQAHALSTVLRGFPLQPAPGVVAVLLAALLGAAAPAAALARLRAVLAVAVVPLAAAALLLGGAQLLFGAGVIVPVAAPLVALAVGVVGTIAVLGVVAAFERQRTRDLFARFVPDAVVGEVLSRTDGQARLGGEQRVATVLFSDLRGFTSFAEQRPPAEVIDVLNRYLTTMTDAILDEGGTLVAYMGDGIMAVFGAPLDQPDHADRALRAARRMTGPCLEGFNAWAREAGVSQEGFRMGVGINSGEVVSGNVGSLRRLEYTVIGDTTNTAARLEGLTKELGRAILVSPSTRELLGEGTDDLEALPEVRIRGRVQGMCLWTPRARGGEDRP
jgi:adenylate cyclase